MFSNHIARIYKLKLSAMKCIRVLLIVAIIQAEGYPTWKSDKTTAIAESAEGKNFFDKIVDKVTGAVMTVGNWTGKMITNAKDDLWKKVIDVAHASQPPPLNLGVTFVMPSVDLEKLAKLPAMTLKELQKLPGVDFSVIPKGLSLAFLPKIPGVDLGKVGLPGVDIGRLGDVKVPGIDLAKLATLPGLNQLSKDGDATLRHLGGLLKIPGIIDKVPEASNVDSGEAPALDVRILEDRQSETDQVKASGAGSEETKAAKLVKELDSPASDMGTSPDSAKQRKKKTGVDLGLKIPAIEGLPKLPDLGNALLSTITGLAG